MKKKLLKKDYNEELEEIAESKRFEKEAQNLLLSMLYKVEIAYDDYKTTKREVPEKEEFIKEIVEIVKRNVREIQIAKPNSELEKILEKTRCKILEEEPENEYNNEQKVIFFPNEKVVLFSIVRAGLEKIRNNLKIEEKSIISLLEIGKCMSYSESIRDFNGFSWQALPKDIENIELNIIYTNLLFLLGRETLNNITCKNVEHLKKYINQDLYYKIEKIALKYYLSYDEKRKEKIEKAIEQDKIKLEKMKNQEKFIEEITKEKKELLGKIKEIDELINNPEDLRKRYLEENSKLPNEKKIFSISHYEEMLQTKRKKILNSIEEKNRLLNPIEYVKEKTEIENKIEYYNSIEIINVLEIQKDFLKEMIKKINNLSQKEDVLDVIYEIRYLKNLPIDEKGSIMKDKIDFKEIEKEAITKGIEQNLITPISNNKESDYELIKSIFDTKNIKLEELLIRLEIEDGKLKSEIYDGNILDSTNYITLQNGSNVRIRKTKKVKIFN